MFLQVISVCCNVVCKTDVYIFVPFYRRNAVFILYKRNFSSVRSVADYPWLFFTIQWCSANCHYCLDLIVKIQIRYTTALLSRCSVACHMIVRKTNYAILFHNTRFHIYFRFEILLLPVGRLCSNGRGVLDISTIPCPVYFQAGKKTCTPFVDSVLVSGSWYKFT